VPSTTLPSLGRMSVWVPGALRTSCDLPILVNQACLSD
jgi:hypothetical protein